MEKQHGHIQRLCTIAFPALLLMTPGLLMVSGVGAMSVGSRVTPGPGEVLVNCFLNEDVLQTKHGFVIRAPSNSSDDHPVTVFGCDWLADNPDTPDCISHYGFTLVDIGKDCVVTSVPQTLLQDGSYRCLLVPQDEDQPFTTCLVLHSEDPPTTISAVTPSTAADQPQPRDQKEDPPTTISAVTPSTAADQPQPRDQKGANGDHSGGLVPAVVALSFTVLILLLMVIVMAVLFLRLKIYRTQTPVDTWEQEDVQVCVPAATCEAEDARPATKSDSETSSEDSESALLGKDGKPLETCCSM